MLGLTIQIFVALRTLSPSRIHSSSLFVQIHSAWLKFTQLGSDTLGQTWIDSASSGLATDSPRLFRFTKAHVYLPTSYMDDPDREIGMGHVQREAERAGHSMTFQAFTT